MGDIANTLWAGYTQVIDADLSKYFDSIPHAKLLAVVAERIVDGGILHLIKQWLKAPIIGEDDNGVKRTVGGGKANRKGTPQGGVISPLSLLYFYLLYPIFFVGGYVGYDAPTVYWLVRVASELPCWQYNLGQFTVNCPAARSGAHNSWK